MHEADLPDLVVDLAYANGLASKHGVEADLASAKAVAVPAVGLQFGDLLPI